MLHSETAFLLLSVVVLLQLASLADLFGLGGSIHTLSACLHICLASYCVVKISTESSREWRFDLACISASAILVHVSLYTIALSLFKYIGIFASVFVTIRVLVDIATILNQARPRKGTVRQTRLGDSLMDLSEISDRLWFTYPSPKVDAYLDQRGMFKVYRFPLEDVLGPLSKMNQLVAEAHVFLWGFPGRVVVVESEQGLAVPVLFACALLLRVGICNSASSALSLFRRRRFFNDEDLVFPAPFLSQLKLLANPRSQSEATQTWLLKRVEISRSATYPVTFLKIVESSQGILVFDGHSDAGNFLMEDAFLAQEDYLVILGNENGFEWYSYFHPSRHLHRVTGLRSSFKYTDEVPDLGAVHFFCADATEGIPLQPNRTRQPELLKISVVDKNL